ncbi:MAG: ABC transporter permease subunit [Candidatus Tectomicrobia bacterium]|uniref:ABC transporter permease subunit n=1 Tax=Tectimicrobiota bacterium TaxID=2528274 RepID=A0A932CP75_UNCTE|nr:ABC transporter permease subunit [Candidatus Tectomicrobia bacterium]
MAVRKIGVIALNTLREAIRDKILYNLLLFALLMIGVSVFLGTLTTGEQVKVVKDMGLACISLFGVLIAVMVGIGLVYKEIDRRTIYTILAKPIRRSEFLLGKYLGLMLTIFLNVLVMAAGLSGITWGLEGIFPWILLKAVLLILVELMVVTSIALLFSTFSTPFLSAMFTLGIYVIGHLSEEFKLLGAQSESPLIRGLSSFLYYLLPDLQNFNIKAEVVHNVPVDPSFIFFSILYGVLYMGITLAIAAAIFDRRDFK